MVFATLQHYLLLTFQVVPRWGRANYWYPVESIQQYILDIQTGQVFDYVLPNMEELLKRDANLYIEFMAFSKRKRRQMMFIYLRKYNERQGLYLGLPSK